MYNSTLQSSSASHSDYSTEYFSRHSSGLKLCIELIRCSSQLDRLIDGNLRRQFGQSISRFDLLAQLARVGDKGMSVGDLGQHLISAKGNITGLVNRMIADGLLKKTAKANDRRSFQITATVKGRSLFKQMAECHSQWVYQLFSDIDLDSMNNISGLLADIRGSLESNELKKVHNEN